MNTECCNENDDQSNILATAVIPSVIAGVVFACVIGFFTYKKFTRLVLSCYTI